MTRPSLLLQMARSGMGVGDSDAPAEWLVTNGLGGYAFGTVAGPPARRFHGLLIAALPAPAGRTLLLHALDEHVVTEDGSSSALNVLGANEPPAVPVRFALIGGLPVWTYALSTDLHLERAVMMPHAENTVYVRYRLLGDSAGARLLLRPWMDVRPHQASLDASPGRHYVCEEAPGGPVEVSVDGEVALRFAALNAASRFEAAPRDLQDIPYGVERDRGYDWKGSASSPGVLSVVLESGGAIYFTATWENWSHIGSIPPDDAWTFEMARRERIIGASNPALQTAETFLLPLAADQFIIRPAARVEDTVRARAAGSEPRSVIAGYPWFTDWGRDTMISLEGLALTTGRAGEARDVLRTFAFHVRDGLIPNLFPEGERHGLYHTADATLWFLHALDRYDEVTGDRSLVESLLPVLEDIVARHRAGTRFNIRVEPDGLLAQGVPGLPLTWMDARMGDWVVTPRRGKPVEINALWHNALMLLHGWLARAGHGFTADELARDARRCRDAFNSRFWNPARQCLFDIVDGDDGDDDSVRPNQLLAISVRHPPLDRVRWEQVLDAVSRELLTPMGLRTLSPSDPAYRSRYAGDLRARDGAYHQGTVWPWLLGPFVDAWLKLHPDDSEGARVLLGPLLDHLLGTGCMGSISEIFDPEAPYTARGCVAQAWSVAELARLLVRVTDTASSTAPLDQS